MKELLKALPFYVEFKAFFIVVRDRNVTFTENKGFLNYFQIE